MLADAHWMRLEPLIGCKKLHPTDSRDKTEPSRTSEPSFAAGRQQAVSAVHHHKRGASARRA